MNLVIGLAQAMSSTAQAIVAVAAAKVSSIESAQAVEDANTKSKWVPGRDKGEDEILNQLLSDLTSALNTVITTNKTTTPTQGS